jgi:MtrB/PioB family decaheme-associated outer membrane protein
MSALAIGMSCGGQALAADIVTKAPLAAEVGWWSSVYAEAGGRFFIDKRGGSTGGNCGTTPGITCTPPSTLPTGLATTHLFSGPFTSLGKFYEYRDLRPGPFGELFASGGTRDGLYQYNFLAKNIGYRDQSYLADWSQAGVQYLTLGFDQLPHTYNDNATTIFQGAGTNTLTVPQSLRSSLAGTSITCLDHNGNIVSISPVCTGKVDNIANTPAGNNAGSVAGFIEGNLNSFRLGYDRYTGTAAYRWTPTDSWDVKVDYNITRRDGTQPSGALTYNNAEREGRVVLELPKPVHDETHNANINVEYNGATPWGARFNANFGYGISIYHDDADSFSFQNPFATADNPGCSTPGTPPNLCAAGSFTPLNNVMSLPPSNMANFLRYNGSLELPMNSRWVSAVNYTLGKQDQGFLPFAASGNGLIGVSGVPPASIAPAPPTLTGGSSNFGSNSFLVNNILTTKWTKELTQTSRYRFYDYDASHDPITLSYLLLADSANTPDIDDFFTSHGVAYTKQNAGSDFVWHPKEVRWLTLGAGGGWEQWNRRWRGTDPGDPDVAVTNEFMGKAFVNAKPWEWSQLRASYLLASRRYDGTYQQNIGGNDECSVGPTGSAVTVNCAGFRAYDLANRDRNKLTVMLDLYGPNNIAVTPTGGFRVDDYSGDIMKNAVSGGLLHDNSWYAGVEVAWTVSPFITLIGSIEHERGDKELWLHDLANSTGNGSAFARDTIETFMGGADLVLVPDKLSLKLAYTLMYAKGALDGNPTTGSSFRSFPDQTQINNRLDVQAKYKIDPTYMQQLGFKGETYVKLRWLWEKNEVSDWAASNWNYMYLFNGDTSQTKNIFLGWNNPNYNVQLLMASVGFKW